MKENVKAVVLYIGTTKLMALASEIHRDGSIHVPIWEKRDSKGFERGLVRDSEAAAEEVQSLLGSVAGSGNKDEFPLYAVISNSEIRNYQVSSSLYFSGLKEISEQDIQNVIHQTRSMATIPLDEIIIWATPQEYLVNDLPKIKNPLGLEGKRLGVTLHLFTLPVTPYRGFSNLWERLEIEPQTLMPRGLASSFSVLRPDEKADGVLLVDLGGTLTELLYFCQGNLCFSKILPWGGESITERVAQRWEIPPRDARRYQEESGSLEPASRAAGECISVTDATGRIRAKIPSPSFQEEIEKSVRSGLEILDREIHSVRDRYRQVYHLVFSGGVTKLNGFLERVQETWNLPSRLGFTSGIHASQELLNHPAHNAILGLLKYLVSSEFEEKERRENANFFARTVGHVKNWIQDYF